VIVYRAQHQWKKSPYKKSGNARRVVFIHEVFVEGQK
jgi:hypothetical protein